MKKIYLLPAFLLYAFTAHSQVKLAGIFGDHMVLQRDQPVPVWGWSSPNESLVVTINQQSKKTKADKKGNWRITLDPQSAGGPYDLSVNGKSSLVFHDVMIGEVWICSGQSNMEFNLKNVRNAAAEINTASYPEIRHIKIPNRISEIPVSDIVSASWETCSPSTAGNFTAVGYFFARELVKRLHVAVGLVNSSWGGTMVETWTSRGAFEKSPEFKEMINAVPSDDLTPVVLKKKEAMENQVKLLQKNINDTIPASEWKYPAYNSLAWPKMSVANLWENQHLGLADLDGIVWFRKEVDLSEKAAAKPVLLSLGKIDDNDSTYVNGKLVGTTYNYSASRQYTVPAGVFKAGKNIIAVRVEDTGGGGGFYDDSASVFLKTDNETIPLSDYWSFRIAQFTSSGQGFGPNDFPCLLYNAMIHPIIPYGIRGALWYQGETNAGRAYQYRTAFPLMINDWRSQWGEGNFPFYFVQLASWNAANGNSEQGSTWAELREAQFLTLSLPATGMSVTTDIGESNDIHPKNKQDVGFRLAAIALSNVYGQAAEYSGPVYASMKTEGNKIELSFTHTGSGLMVKDKYGYIRGFEVAGANHHFHYAKAFLQNNKVIVYADNVPDPVSVHYNWADDAPDGNLYNQEGFPALPFRTDQWKGITDDTKYVVGK
jgi:sialate O-acetylesterase